MNGKEVIKELKKMIRDLEQYEYLTNTKTMETGEIKGRLEKIINRYEKDISVFIRIKCEKCGIEDKMIETNWNNTLKLILAGC